MFSLQVKSSPDPVFKGCTPAGFSVLPGRPSPGILLSRLEFQPLRTGSGPSWSWKSFIYRFKWKKPGYHWIQKAKATKRCHRENGKSLGIKISTDRDRERMLLFGSPGSFCQEAKIKSEIIRFTGNAFCSHLCQKRKRAVIKAGPTETLKINQERTGRDIPS